MTDRFGVPAWARFGVKAVVAAVVVAGCTGADPDPAPTTPAATATVSESPTQAPTVTSEPTEAAALPPLPDAAKENTPEGAEAFIRYYVDVANVALTTPAIGLIPPLAHEDCLSCLNMEQQAKELVAQRQRATKPPYSVKVLDRVGGTSESLEMFNMTLVLNATALEAEDGTVGPSSEAEEVSGTGAATWSEGAWRILDFDLQPPS